MRRLSIILIALLILSTATMADTRLQLVGQFGKKAVLLINGVQRIVQIDQVSPEGVKLLLIEPDYVIVLDNGHKKKVTFSTQQNTQYDKKEVKKVDIWADNTGSYVTPGSINEQAVTFLIDTGATSIAMNEVVARRLGLDYRYTGKRIQATTASGVVAGHAIKLSSVKVGSIHLTDVDAVVVEGGYPTKVLLGMSFLQHVNLERTDNLMTLKYTK